MRRNSEAVVRVLGILVALCVAAGLLWPSVVETTLSVVPSPTTRWHRVLFTILFLSVVSAAIVWALALASG